VRWQAKRDTVLDLFPANPKRRRRFALSAHSKNAEIVFQDGLPYHSEKFGARIDEEYAEASKPYETSQYHYSRFADRVHPFADPSAGKDQNAADISS
jgi:hypothetical protein